MELKEQYLDLLKCRRFRQTLLCHEDRELDYVPRPEKIRGGNNNVGSDQSSPREVAVISE